MGGWLWVYTISHITKNVDLKCGLLREDIVKKIGSICTHPELA